MRRRVCRPWSATLCGALLSACLYGCTRESAPNRYETLTGVVVERHADTGEIAVRTADLRSDSDALARCLITKDTEVYLNDALATLDAINVGDPVRLIGYNDPSTRIERLIVSFARIDRPRPPPQVPDFLERAAELGSRNPKE